MKSFLRKHWPELLTLAAILACVAAFAWQATRAPELPAVDVVRELNAERIEDAKAEEQTKRRAARVRVDQEVSRAVRDSDLADYFERRAPR